MKFDMALLRAVGRAAALALAALLGMYFSATDYVMAAPPNDESKIIHISFSPLDQWFQCVRTVTGKPLVSAFGIHQLTSGGPESIVGILRQADLVPDGRMIYGEYRDGKPVFLWDSPLFPTRLLSLAYKDVDGDGTQEILLRAEGACRASESAAIANDLSSQFGKTSNYDGSSHWARSPVSLSRKRKSSSGIFSCARLISRASGSPSLVPYQREITFTYHSAGLEKVPCSDFVCLE
jgi:hypothetical protein